LKILFVDDNELNRMVMEDMLELLIEGATVDVFEDAFTVLEQDLESYDIILSDIDMPKMNGFELLETLRKDYNFTKPVIAVTAHAVSGDKEKMLEFGFDDYISKPVDINKLEEAISRFQ
jgi:CheY-like chemotaxis protein